MNLEQINVVGLQAAHRFDEAALNAFCRKIKIIQAIAAAFGSEHHLMAFPAEGISQAIFRESQSVVWRNIKKIYSIVNGERDGAIPFHGAGGRVDVSER